MSRIRNKNTNPEIFVRKYLSTQGIKYRCNVKTLPGSPDIAIKKYKTAILVNGCFWHSHKNCKDFKVPNSNINFWKKKLSENVLRDKKNIEKIMCLGFKVFTIWECQIKSKNFSEIDKAIKHIKSDKSFNR